MQFGNRFVTKLSRQLRDLTIVSWKLFHRKKKKIHKNPAHRGSLALLLIPKTVNSLDALQQTNGCTSGGNPYHGLLNNKKK